MNILVLFGHGNKPGLLRLLKAVDKKLSMKGYHIYHAIDNENDTFINYGFEESSICRVKGLRKKRGFINQIIKKPVDKTLERFCQINNVNLILSYTLSTLPRAIDLSNKSAIPCVAWLHNDYPDAAKKYRKFGVDRCNNFIAVSNFILDSVRTYLGSTQKNLQVVHNAIDFETFISQADTQEIPAALCRIKNDDFVIGMIAVMDTNKNPQLLLKAFAHAKNTLTEKKIKLLFAGRFPDREYELETKKLVDQLGLTSQVFFMGFQSNVSAIFRRLDLFLYPSFRDACPLAPMEAMAWGKPVIASRTGGVPEIVEDGVTGILCDPGNADQFAIAIKRLADDPVLRKVMGKRGKERVLKMFSINKMSENIDEIFKSVIG